MDQNIQMLAYTSQSYNEIEKSDFWNKKQKFINYS